MLEKPKKAIMQKRNYRKGSIIFAQNENSSEIYILNEGILEIIVDNKIVAEISERGVFFGEMSHMLDGKRNATIRTKTDCSCIVIYAQYVNLVVRSNPEIGVNLMKSLANRLRKTTKLLLKSLDSEKSKPSNDKASLRLKSFYDLIILMKMATNEQVKEALALQKQEGKKENIIRYLSKIAEIDENDLIVLTNLFKKYRLK